jgi:hypothetical protein
MDDNYRTLDEATLLIAAESRIDTAIAQLLMRAHGVREAARHQDDAVTELREARNAIKALRERLQGSAADPDREAGG